MEGRIYIHRNKINGKCYVGQTIQKPKQRWRKGEGYRGCSKFWRAIQKYGWGNFEHIILPDIYKTDYDLDQAEKFWIMKLDSVDNGYNCKDGGQNGCGFKHSKESRKKMGASRRGKTWYTNNELDGLYFEGEQPEGWFLGQSISRRAKSSKARKGRAFSEEHKRKISEGNKGKKRTEEQNKANSEHRKGKVKSEEFKLKVSKALKGRPAPPERGKHISEAKIGHTVSEETRKKISETLRSKKQNRF